MFRVSFVCEDQKLAAVLHGLSDIAAAPPEVQPVLRENGHQITGNGHGQMIGSGTPEERFIQHAKQRGLNRFVRSDVRDFCDKSPMPGYYYLMQKLRKAGLIKKHGKGPQTYYTVVE